MVIQNSFPKKDHSKIAQEVHDMILAEKRLTPRSYNNIKRLIGENSVYVAQENNQNIGCIIKEHLADHIYELKSLYVIPKKRRHGVGNALLKISINQKSHIYLASTFYPEIVSALQRYGFTIIQIYDLPFPIIVRYIMTRSWKSILKHLLKQKSYLLIKYP